MPPEKCKFGPLVRVPAIMLRAIYRSEVVHEISRAGTQNSLQGSYHGQPVGNRSSNPNADLNPKIFNHLTHIKTIVIRRRH